MNGVFEISSIFMVIVNKKSRKSNASSYLLLAALLLLIASIGSFTMFNAYQNILPAKTSREKNVCVLQFLIGMAIIFAYFSLIFLCDWNQCVEFIKIWTQCGLQNDQETIKYVKCERKKYRLIICILVVVFAVTAVLFNPRYSRSLHQISVYQLMAIVSISISYPALYSLVFDFPLQFSLIICAVFIRANQRLEHLVEYPESIDGNIKSIRLMHSVGSQLTLKADQFIRYFTAVNYFIMISFLLINLYSIVFLSESLTDYFAGIGLQFVVISMTAIFTYYAVKINHLASKGFHHAYQLTFTENCPSSFAETSLLIYRMGRNDIGLTFANLFTITASFVTSLLTLCITIILAFPTIKSQF